MEVGEKYRNQGFGARFQGFRDRSRLGRALRMSDLTDSSLGVAVQVFAYLRLWGPGTEQHSASQQGKPGPLMTTQ